jgi:hypothetical protein
MVKESYKQMDEMKRNGLLDHIKVAIPPLKEA